MSSYDDKPNGKLDLSEFAQVIHDLSAVDEAPAAPVPKKNQVYEDKPDGKMDLSEFAQAVRDLSAAEEAPKVKQTFAGFDTNNSGYLEIQELRKAA